MDDDRPLFSTFRSANEDKAASTQPGHGAAPVQPPRAEQPPARRDAQGRALPGWPPPGGGAQPELVALWARTRLWFEQTQARRLGAELPAWFHGFISRRETEQLLQDQPPGCFLVRFSESTVGFVLSYRGRDRCRHFVLDQLPDGRYVILGERSAHGELAELLRHYTAAPVAPYREVLTVPCPRQDKPHGGPAYGTVAKRPPGARQTAGDGTEGGSGEVPGTPPPLPAKVGSSSASQGPRSRAGSRGAAPEGPYAQVHHEAIPAEPPEAKYQQLVRFHTYAEPRECTEPPGGCAGDELEEPIPFYAVGRGCSPAPEENVYSEVALAQRELPPLLPRGARGPVSTLPPKTRAPTEPTYRRLFRSFSSQASRRRQPPAAPTAGGGHRGAPSPPPEVGPPPSHPAIEALVPPKLDPNRRSRRGGPRGPGGSGSSQGGFPFESHPQAPRNPSLEFDDPVYGQRKGAAKRPEAPVGQENIYEQLSGDRP